MPPRLLTLLLVVLMAVTVARQRTAARAARGADARVTDAVAALDRKERVLRTHMSTKTMYPAPSERELADEMRRANAQLSSNTTASEPSCRAVQLNFVVRHGTRFPTIKDITRVRAAHAKLRRLFQDGTAAAAASPGVQRWLGDDDWRVSYDADRAGWLAPAGAFEQIALGQRLRARFFAGDDEDAEATPAYDADAFVFEHTYKPRTQQSAMGFAYGLFGGVQPVHFRAARVGEDHALRFFDNCPRFAHRIDANKTATAHHAAYRASAQMRRNLRRFRQLVGLREDDARLTQNDLEAAYAGCAFDVSVRDELSEWCALFDEQMLLSMDYFHDLKHFYKKSHGHALAFEIAAPLLQDLHASMRARALRRSRVRGHFRFAHAETILPLASLLNLSYFDRHASDREGHFLAETPLDVAVRRSFRGSALAPFSANIGFVLYECEGESTDGARATSYKVQTLLHERTVRFPQCDDRALCPFEKFEEMFAQWIHEYDFFAQCALD